MNVKVQNLINKYNGYNIATKPSKNGLVKYTQFDLIINTENEFLKLFFNNGGFLKVEINYFEYDIEKDNDIIGFVFLRFKNVSIICGIVDFENGELEVFLDKQFEG